MISRLELRNFTAFNNLEISFSPKINVIIGENGTGKTHLMKAAYGLCLGSDWLVDRPELDESELSSLLSRKFIRLFSPMDDKLGKLRRHGTTGHAQVAAHFPLAGELLISFHRNSNSLKILDHTDHDHLRETPVIIPTKEVLTLVQGISSDKSDQDTIQILFDDTYVDLCELLLVEPPSDESERIQREPRFAAVFSNMVEAIGGRYEFADGRFYFHEGNYVERRLKDQSKFGDMIETIFRPVRGSELSNNMTAEGFRKIGILQQLLLNRSLAPGVSGPLFWDEPEANMNPMLLQLLVQLLLELSRNGQQIILSTHDFVVLKWFDLLMSKEKGDHVRFHTLYRDPDSGEISLSSTDDYRMIEPNSIADTYSDLTDSEISRAMRGLRA